ncbi:hypothetical protein PYCCODRAFT_1070559 [Trametes coccinea BRFM310]|uniref:Uncharacterized protein n=1 Tax=Trametes coccinea (strain BRFM310) TaxID=1353009 RepID=A0A1Y2IY38_TRAC3|nr:hypothetical protein PYCCODRAFT_1070559 [Trametes coccinea BRFM310]
MGEKREMVVVAEKEEDSDRKGMGRGDVDVDEICNPTNGALLSADVFVTPGPAGMTVRSYHRPASHRSPHGSLPYLPAASPLGPFTAILSRTHAGLTRTDGCRHPALSSSASPFRPSTATYGRSEPLPGAAIDNDASGASPNGVGHRRVTPSHSSLRCDAPRL